ncbi:MAG: sensor histidine kinase [Leptospirillia bacterium]
MKPRLLWKLLAVNVLLITGVIAMVWLAVDTLAADYFAVLMSDYHISPTESHQMFVDAIHRYIIWASLGGLLLALILSFFLTRRMLRPLTEMSDMAKDISTGNYKARVQGGRRDEVGEVGDAFNVMADSLERVEALRKTMVSDVAHELRTPLTNMRGYLEALRDGVVSSERKVFAMLLNEVLRLVTLVNDLQQITRADAAHAVLERADMEVEDLISESVALFAPQIEAKGIRLHTHVEPGAERVRADRARMLQVARNLIQNACQYTGQNGEVSIRSEPVDGHVRLSVTNTGEAIPEAELPYIFERFYRVDKSRSRDSGGSGIGLAIVKQLIEAHGGSVGAESGGDTTRVWVMLPT